MKDSKFTRVLRLLTMLQSGQPYTVDELAELFGVTRRTVFRDLKELKKAGVRYHHDKETYCYRMDRDILPPWVELNKRDALALLLPALRMQDMPFRKLASDAAVKILTGLPAEIREYCIAVLRNISTKPAPQMLGTSFDRIFGQFLQAILKRRIVSIRYRLPGKRMSLATELCPHRLLYDKHTWNVIGRSSHHKAIHAFRLNLISELKILDKCFLDEDNLGANEYPGKAWSTKPENRLYEVKLRFSPEIVHEISEIQWHSTQTISIQADGSAIVEFRVDGLDEIVWWIFSFANRVKVLSPRILRERIAEIARGIIENNDP